MNTRLRTPQDRPTFHRLHNQQEEAKVITEDGIIAVEIAKNKVKE
jgi:hypothetical protein